MKIAFLHLVVILISTVRQAQAQSKGLSQDTEEYTACKNACKMELHQRRYICAESKRFYYHRCEFECAKKAAWIKPEDLKEVECKPGSFAHCWNTECTDDERKYPGGTPMCRKYPPHSKSEWPCHDKCMHKSRKNMELELVPCSEVKKE